MKQPNWKPLLFTCTMAALGLQAQAQQVLKPELQQAILKTRQGSIVELPDFLTEKIQNIGYQKVVLPGPQHVISDDPEYIRVPEAIALQEAVQPGAVRLYVYNVNGVKEPAKIDRRITAVIKNNGTADDAKYCPEQPSGNLR